MNVLVTGTAGFIGSHVAHALLNEGHTVVGYDNFNDYYGIQLKVDRHAALEKRHGYAGIRADLCDQPTLARVFGETQFDAVCHLAAQAGVRYSLTHPHAYQKSNLEGFLNILEACRQARIPRLVYASSSSVYGGNTKLPFSESDPVDTPVSLYAATKKANELMAHTYTHSAFFASPLTLHLSHTSGALTRNPGAALPYPLQAALSASAWQPLFERYNRTATHGYQWDRCGGAGVEGVSRQPRR